MEEFPIIIHSNSYVILSAKHGFLFPFDIIPETYNVTFNRKRTNPISLDRLKGIAIEKKLYDYDRIVVIAGKLYVEMTQVVFKGKNVAAPLENCRNMFEMIELVDKTVKLRKPFLD